MWIYKHIWKCTTISYLLSMKIYLKWYQIVILFLICFEVMIQNWLIQVFQDLMVVPHSLIVKLAYEAILNNMYNYSINTIFNLCKCWLTPLLIYYGPAYNTWNTSRLRVDPTRLRETYMYVWILYQSCCLDFSTFIGKNLFILMMYYIWLFSLALKLLLEFLLCNFAKPSF